MHVQNTPAWCIECGEYKKPGVNLLSSACFSIAFICYDCVERLYDACAPIRVERILELQDSWHAQEE